MLDGVVRVLIAEDEERLAEAIARGLRREGMAVDLAPDGTDALVKARVIRYDVLVRGDIELDPARRVVSRGANPIELTRKEFGVLEVLMSADGATISAEELLERVWDEHIDPFTNVVRMTIMTLRRKLGDPPVVETVIGVGYRMV